ncbi:MAG TPA: septal ring lytic transglycosylase RlpA family protein [Planktothrix sp.]
MRPVRALLLPVLLCSFFVAPVATILFTPSAQAIETDIEGADFSGVADYYADCFHGRRTASGQLHDKTKLTAAHRTLPFGTKLKLVNRRTGKSCVVTVNDRGPFTKNRIIDVSKAAAQELGLFKGARMVDCYIISMP